MHCYLPLLSPHYMREPQQQPLQTHEVALSAACRVGGGGRWGYCDEQNISAGSGGSGTWGIAGVMLS